MGYTYCKSAALSTPKYTEKAMEFLRAGHDGADCTYVLPQS